MLEYDFEQMTFPAALSLMGDIHILRTAKEFRRGLFILAVGQAGEVGIHHSLQDVHYVVPEPLGRDDGQEIKTSDQYRETMTTYIYLMNR